jgi:hypothetical protein
MFVHEIMASYRKIKAHEEEILELDPDTPIVLSQQPPPLPDLSFEGIRSEYPWDEQIREAVVRAHAGT